MTDFIIGIGVVLGICGAIFFFTVGLPHIIAKYFYEKEIHHSGMDIEHTKEEV